MPSQLIEQAGQNAAPGGFPFRFLRSRTEPSSDLRAGYERACAASRQVAAGFLLDDSVPHPRIGQVSLRWIYVHMIEESARHVGHADILREQTDGATGFDG